MNLPAEWTVYAPFVMGAALLLLGRQLFWLFVGGAGFVAGMIAATHLLTGLEPEWIMAISLAAGAVGIVLSLLLQRLTLRVAGFLAAGYVSFMIYQEWTVGPWGWACFIGGGIVGALMVMAVFNWALICLSALTGATLIAQQLPIAPPWIAVLWTLLLAVGVAIQSTVFVRANRRSPPSDAAE